MVFGAQAVKAESAARLTVKHRSHTTKVWPKQPRFCRSGQNEEASVCFQLLYTESSSFTSHAS